MPVADVQRVIEQALPVRADVEHDRQARRGSMPAAAV
jgi:hypothetical protein